MNLVNTRPLYFAYPGGKSHPRANNTEEDVRANEPEVMTHHT